MAPDSNRSASETPVTPPGAWKPLTRVLELAKMPLERFLRIEASSGILLLGVALLALGWANSPWANSYFALWHTNIGLSLGTYHFERSLEWFVNDGLMVIFFFVVGMEIRREIHHGELSEWRRAALPFAAALGGMVAPALLYLAIAGDAATRSGWGVPMATDIAFAVGILTLLGNRVPPALRVLLLALAVIDDLGAIIVIAVFYSSGIAFAGLLVASLGVLAVLGLQAFGIRQKVVYILPALVIWAGIYASGIHPTIAGVIIGMLTPVTVWLGPTRFVQHVQSHLDQLNQQEVESMGSHDLNHTLQRISAARREAMSPAETLIQLLHPWVAFVIMPIFALANAGVAMNGLILDAASASAGLGIVIGLVLGKPLGILLACALVLRLRIAKLPHGISWSHLAVLGMVAGVGFTMALFVAQLAFARAQHLLGVAKLGILVASAAAGVIGLIVGRLRLAPTQPPGIALSADDAEASTET